MMAIESKTSPTQSKKLNDWTNPPVTNRTMAIITMMSMMGDIMKPFLKVQGAAAPYPTLDLSR